MKFEKRDNKGNSLGHYEPTDEQVDAQEIWTHKVHGDEETRKKERATTRSAMKPPKGMKLLCVQEDVNDGSGTHDLYVFGTDAIKFTEAEAVEEMTPRVGFDAVTKAKEEMSAPPPAA